MGEVTLYETFVDLVEKVSGGLQVVWGLRPGGPFQLGTEIVRGAPVTVFKTLAPTLRDTYMKWFTAHSDRTWLVYEGERYTFGEVMRQFNAVGAELASSFGIKQGDRVGICMRNYPEFLISFLAITGMGGVAVPLNALWKSEELEYAVTDSGCRLLIIDPERMALCERFVGDRVQCIIARGSHGSYPTWEEVLANGRRRPAPTVSSDPEDEAMIMYTSGSTGFPKGVCHTQRSVGSAIKVGELMGCVIPDPDSCNLLAVPLFHITALSPIALCSIPAGGKIVMMRKWEAGVALDAIEAESVTRFTGVPTMVRDILEHPNFTPERVRTLKNMLAGGAPVPPTQVAKMRSKAKKVKSGQGYGLTETMAFATAISGTDYVKRPTSCGRPLPLLVDIKIKDPATGAVVPDGERGEVCIRSAMIMKCYYNKPEKTAEAIDNEGYFHSGDIGKMEGGFLYILDRMKDLIIRGGENIDCSEVEAALTTHPAVRECSVFALPDPRLGEIVGAAIWCTDPNVTAEEIRANVHGKLAKFKVPEACDIFLHQEELPKGATGKLDKKGLRDRYAKVVEARPLKASL